MYVKALLCFCHYCSEFHHKEISIEAAEVRCNLCDGVTDYINGNDEQYSSPGTVSLHLVYMFPSTVEVCRIHIFTILLSHQMALQTATRIYNSQSVVVAEAHQALSIALMTTHQFNDDSYFTHALDAWRCATDVVEGGHPSLAPFKFTLCEYLYH